MPLMALLSHAKLTDSGSLEESALFRPFQAIITLAILAAVSFLQVLIQHIVIFFDKIMFVDSTVCIVVVSDRVNSFSHQV
jgi:hypothetical protein